MLIAMGYPGGKGRQAPKIVGLLPPHEVYIEAFAGSAAVAKTKRPARRTILIDRDSDVVERIRHWAPDDWDIRCQNALTFLGSYQCSGSELIYCDPPYVRSSRRNSRRIYRYDFEDAEHRQLLDIVCSLSCPVVLSGYPSELYQRALTSWTLTRFQVNTRGGRAVECVWTNYKTPYKLHDERYIGHDYRRRQDAKRRLSRLKTRISTLSHPEQHALLSWLTARTQEVTGEASR